MTIDRYIDRYRLVLDDNKFSLVSMGVLSHRPPNKIGFSRRNQADHVGTLGDPTFTAVEVRKPTPQLSDSRAQGPLGWQQIDDLQGILGVEAMTDWKIQPPTIIQWIALRENLQENVCFFLPNNPSLGGSEGGVPADVPSKQFQERHFMGTKRTPLSFYGKHMSVIRSFFNLLGQCFLWCFEKPSQEYEHRIIRRTFWKICVKPATQQSLYDTILFVWCFFVGADRFPISLPRFGAHGQLFRGGEGVAICREVPAEKKTRSTWLLGDLWEVKPKLSQILVEKTRMNETSLHTIQVFWNTTCV